ncbi:MAG: lysostaphin resistance A-like protein [Terriglobia bacterium]
MIRRLKRRLPYLASTPLDYYDVTWFLFAAGVLGLALHLAVVTRWLPQTALTHPSLLLQAAIMSALIFALPLIVKVRGRASPWAELGWRSTLPRHFAVALLAGLLMALAIIVVVWTSYPVIPNIPLGVGVLLAVVLGPVLEESLFRGCLLPVLSRSLGLAGAVIVTSLLFGLLHHPPTILHYACFTLAGIAYAWIRITSQSTAPATLMHATHNLALLLWPRFGPH